MVYNWDGKETDCYRLYVQEKKSLDEVMEYWEQRGFTPSRRAFQTQFKRWGFPSKQNPAHKNPVLIARVTELWQQNYMQKDMLETLLAEGFQINDRELMRLRQRLKLYLRERIGCSSGRRKEDEDLPIKKKKRKKRKIVRGNGLIDQLANAILLEDSASEVEDSEPEYVEEQSVQGRGEPTATPAATQPIPQALDPEEVLRKRQQRLEQLRAESDEKFRTRKRRRRMRGWAGLPPDAPGEPPRFPSETTLDESKAYLGLDNKSYKEVRERFQSICEEQGVIKKTIAGPEKWAQLVQRLIREHAHLDSVFRGEPEVLEQSDALWKPKSHKALALDVICQDVTKRMRVMETRMSVAEAKNALGLNPEQTRHVRSAFTIILKENHLVNKLEAGERHWNALKERWVRESELLRHTLAAGEADPKHAEKWKAVEIIARDVMKRLRAGHSQNAPEKQQKQEHTGPGPGPAPPTVLRRAPSSHTRNRKIASNSNAPPQSSSTSTIPSTADLQIDPSLLLAASDASIVPAAPALPLQRPFYHSPHQLDYHHLHPSHIPQQPTYLPPAHQ